MTSPDTDEITEFLCHDCGEVVDIEDVAGPSECCPAARVCKACAMSATENE
jgi:acetone carboxylase gamma subunit